MERYELRRGCCVYQTVANVPGISSTGIDLTNTIPKLDATASEIVANQRDALVQRKDLAQKTKDFRKLDDASKLTEYKGLLKGRHKHHMKLCFGI